MNTNTTPLPIRYRQDRPYGAQLDVLARELANGGRLSSSQIFHRCRWLVNHEPITAHLGSETAVPGTPDEVAAVLANIEARNLQETMFAKAYVMFASAGGQVFEFSKNLTDMFLRSDVDDVPAAGLHLPYERFFIHFQQPVALRDPSARASAAPLAIVDGAYIERVLPDLISITPSVPRLAKGEEYAWMRENEDAIDGGILIRLGRGTLGDAAAEATRLYVEENRKRSAQSIAEHIERPRGRPLSSQTKEMVSKAMISYVNRLDEAGLLKPVIHQLVNLTANALCYVTAYRESGQRTWPGRTPKEVVGALERATSPKRQQQIERELNWAGYRRVTLFLLDSDSTSPAGGTHGSPMAHWRRGHWRMQAHGEAHSLRRLQWIRPCLIKPQGPREIQGRVYVAESDLAPSF